MQTALRLVLDVLGRIRLSRPDLPLALYGLYAPAAAQSGALHPGDVAIAGEVGPALCTFLESLGDREAPVGGVPADGAPEGPAPVQIKLGRARGTGAVRTGVRPEMAGLERYARLLHEGPERLVGMLEATSGCNHRCRHCPVPVVFDGRSRPVEREALLAEVDELVGLGAQHLHFADPDFLNRPGHALAVARDVHLRHPDLSFDATVKVSHILRHEAVLGELAHLGLMFVVSAFESTSDLVLGNLDKGHTKADAARSVRVLRNVGVEIRPSFLPFTPWTRREDLIELLDFVAGHDLVANVDPVQYGIRLLLPPGSLLLREPDPVLAAALGHYDADQLSTTWHSPDPLLDELQRLIARIAEAAGETNLDPRPAYDAVRHAVFSALGTPDGGPPRATSTGPGGIRPHLSEAWFCCAEPTSSQFARLRA